MKISIQSIERVTGLPPSIQFLRNTAIDIVIDWEGDQPSLVNFTVAGGSTQNGNADIIGARELDNSGIITLRGIAQTEPGHDGKITLQAHHNGVKIEESVGFSVCAHPSAVWNGPDFAPHIAVNDKGRHVGMFIQIRIESDSGDVADLNLVKDLERVSEARDHSTSMNGKPKINPETAKEELIQDFMFDRHRVEWDALMLFAVQFSGIDGSWSNDQLDFFNCPRCGMRNWSIIPKSGYRVERSFFTTSDGRIRHRIRKYPYDVTVENSSTSAGPGEPAEVVIDIEPFIKEQTDAGSDLLKLAGIT